MKDPRTAIQPPCVRHGRGLRLAVTAMALGLLTVLPGCSNNPYPLSEAGQNILYRAIPSDLRTLDPTSSYVVTEAILLDLICPSFYQYHFLKRDPYELELALGAEHPVRKPAVITEVVDGKEVRHKGETWTFRIKKGLRFQDDPCFPGGKGREITASDFIYSFRRMADPGVNPPCPVLPFFEDKIVGLSEYVKSNRKLREKQRPADYAAPVAGLQPDPRDPYAFQIRLNQPYPQLKYLMAMHFTTPIPREAVAKYGEELKRHPVGCGPFLMEDFQVKRRWVLAKNPNRMPEFYPTEGEPSDRAAGLLDDAGKPLPLADKIVFTYVREPITAWNFFMQGYIDNWAVYQENLRQVLTPNGQLTPEMQRKGVRLQKSVTPQISYFGFNMKDPVFGGYTEPKRKLRQAVSLAIDAEEFRDLINQGVGIPAQSIIPPSIYGYDPAFKNPYRQHSVEHGKRLLAEAGYPDGIDPRSGDRLTLYFDHAGTESAGRQFAALVKKQIERIGIRVEDRVWRDIIWQDRLDKGQVQFYRYGWLADYPDPENFVFLLYGPNKRPGPNSASYASPEYDRLFEQMRAMEDTPERLAIINKMREIAVEDCPWIYLLHDEDLLLSYDWLRNTKPHGVANDVGKYRAVDVARRAQRHGEWNRPNFWPPIVLALLIIAGSVPAAAVVKERRYRRARRSKEA